MIIFLKMESTLVRDAMLHFIIQKINSIPSVDGPALMMKFQVQLEGNAMLMAFVLKYYALIVEHILVIFLKGRC